MNYGDGISLIIATFRFRVFIFFVSYLMLMEIVIFITLFSSLPLQSLAGNRFSLVRPLSAEARYK